LAENSNEIRAARSFAWLTSAIALLVGSIGMLNTMMMAVFERTKEIAMLRALGWRRRRIVGMILGESLLLSFVGALIGICAAIWLVHWLSQLPASGRMVSGEVHLSVVLLGVLMAIALGLLGGILPSLKAARLLPVEGLRHD
jgi:putative ABC transport system permease protein